MKIKYNISNVMAYTQSIAKREICGFNYLSKKAEISKINHLSYHFKKQNKPKENHDNSNHKLLKINDEDKMLNPEENDTRWNQGKK